MLPCYIIRSKHRSEDFLCRQIQSRELEAYYPCIRVNLSNPDSRSVKPYFPGSLCVHTDLDVVGVYGVQWIPGTIGLVSFGGEPAWASDGVLQGIRDQVEQINLAGWESWQKLKTGDEVIIHSGPFAGYRGIFSSYLSDHERVIVFLKFVRDQQVRVELPVGQIASTKPLQA